MKQINSKEKFLKMIHDKEKALNRADHCRDLDLDLYWRRAAYYWAFAAAAFAGYFILSTNDNPRPEQLLVISCLGTIFSFVWYLANRGGKYWHTNWEYQIDLLEDECAGLIYKTNIINPRQKFWHPIEGYPFSVTKLNHILSAFITLVWIVMTISAAIDSRIGLRGKLTAHGIILTLTVIFFILLPLCARTTKSDTKRKINMEIREYEDKNG